MEPDRPYRPLEWHRGSGRRGPLDALIRRDARDARAHVSGADRQRAGRRRSKRPVRHRVHRLRVPWRRAGVSRRRCVRRVEPRRDGALRPAEGSATGGGCVGRHTSRQHTFHAWRPSDFGPCVQARAALTPQPPLPYRARGSRTGSLRFSVPAPPRPVRSPFPSSHFFPFFFAGLSAWSSSTAAAIRSSPLPTTIFPGCTFLPLFVKPPIWAIHRTVIPSPGVSPTA